MIGKKIKTLLTDGTEPYEVGKINFKNPTHEVEDLAIQRAKVCAGCRYFKTDPIPFLRVTDVNVPELSEKSCGRCGCILSYKTRQSIKICSRWAKL